MDLFLYYIVTNTIDVVHAGWVPSPLDKISIEMFRVLLINKEKCEFNFRLNYFNWNVEGSIHKNYYTTEYINAAAATRPSFPLILRF